MFCPKCGNADQQTNNYCRNCGTFLPDFDKIKRQNTPETHLLANSVLNVMTAVGSLALAITLYAMFLGKEGTPFIIYLTAGFLTAVFFWQAQIFIRLQLLKKQLPKGLSGKKEETNETPQIESVKTNQLLNEPKFDDYISPSVIEQTTKNLDKIPRK
ncbi:MAG TPA: hypothetical protein PKY59_19580 [Pyrinomonadaceae bacterium]|nr:hypothetical protein [Pyrinomonadaceae bacterium]